MKIAKVCVIELEGMPVGAIAGVFNTADEAYGARMDNFKLVEVADDFQAGIHDAVIAEDGSITFEINAQRQATEVALQKNIQIKAAYDAMTSDVLNAMAAAFGTTNTDSALAQQQTLKDMLEDPAFWASKGLLADMDTTSFDVGDALNTNQKITDFATERIEVIKDYGVQRQLRIQQFRSERDAILA